MSTVVAFTPSRSRHDGRPLAPVVPIGAARIARSADAEGAASGGSAGLTDPVGRARVAVQRERERAAQVAVEVDWSAVAPSPLRLTRRGRMVAGVAAGLVVAVVLGVLVLMLGHQAVAGEEARPVTASYHTVLPGETLWSIAAEVAPAADRHDTIDRIVEFNALGTPGLQAGQRIAIPAGLGGR